MVLPLTAPEGQLSIQGIISKNPTKKYVEKVQKYDEKLIMHNTGIGKDKAIDKFDYYEAKRLSELRKRYTPSNKDFAERLHRPCDKIFTAKGGSSNYFLSSKEEKESFINILRDIANGYSLRQWIETYWLPAYFADPMGLIFMEVGNNTCYPTYKSAESIYAMPKPNGRKFDWIVFKLGDPSSANATYGGAVGMDMSNGEASGTEVGANVQYYRVVDDKFDYTIKWVNGEAEVVDLYPNYFGFVPAITVSGLWDAYNEIYVSPDDGIISIYDQHLRSRSVLVIYELEHGYPLHWQYQSSCPTCKGTGKVRASDCTSCNGSGIKSKNDVAERLMLPVPKDKEVPVLAPHVAGVVEVAVESWQEMKSTIDRQYKEAHYCMWGTHQIEDSSSAQPATATGRFIDVQPVNDRLGKFSDEAEFVEMWLTNMSGRFHFPNTYKGCQINYGRRYLIETPDVIWEKYDKAKNSGANVGALNNLYQQYVDSEYSGDEWQRMKMMNMFKLEPLPHQTMQQAQLVLSDPISFNKKVYFGQWLCTLKNDELITLPFEKLNQMLTDYVASLNIPEPIEAEPKPVKTARKRVTTKINS